MRFRLNTGRRIQKGPDVTIRNKKTGEETVHETSDAYKKGDVFESDDDLVAKDGPARYSRVADDAPLSKPVRTTKGVVKVPIGVPDQIELAPRTPKVRTRKPAFAEPDESDVHDAGDDKDDADVHDAESPFGGDDADPTVPDDHDDDSGDEFPAKPKHRRTKGR